MQRSLIRGFGLCPTSQIDFAFAVDHSTADCGEYRQAAGAVAAA
jgi:hypothetical protein